MKRESKRTGVFTRRALLVGGVQVAALGVLGAKLYQVQVVEGGKFATLAETNRISARLIAPPRGRLLDRSGVPVAGNNQNWRALLIAEQTDDAGATLDNLAAFAQLTGQVPAHLFDACFDSTLGRAEVFEFLARENPQALAQGQVGLDRR